MNNTNCLVFDRDYYDCQEDFDKDMINFIKILTHNNYTCQIIQTVETLYEVWFNSCDRELGETYPRWLTEDEFDLYKEYKYSREDDLK